MRGSSGGGLGFVLIGMTIGVAGTVGALWISGVRLPTAPLGAVDSRPPRTIEERMAAVSGACHREYGYDPAIERYCIIQMRSLIAQQALDGTAPEDIARQERVEREIGAR